MPREGIKTSDFIVNQLLILIARGQRAAEVNWIRKRILRACAWRNMPRRPCGKSNPGDSLKLQ
jgi:hypothetical protein